MTSHNFQTLNVLSSLIRSVWLIMNVESLFLYVFYLAFLVFHVCKFNIIIKKKLLVKPSFHCGLTWNKINLHLRMIFVSCFFIIETSSTHVISASLWVNTFLFHEITKTVYIKTFWYLVYVFHKMRKLQRKPTN